MNKRMDRTRLNIGAYILQPYARTETHIKDVAECGIDFIVCMENDRPALDLFYKYNIGAIVTGVVPGWWGGDGSNAGKLEETNPMSKYKEAAASFTDHPAIWGIDVGDEPSALDFPYYSKVTNYVNSAFPNQFAYLNIYPNYASVAQNNTDQRINQLGTPTYTEHVQRYCELIPLDYLCYDFYLYSINVSKYYENLCVVADACRKTRRSMWIVLQVNSSNATEWISENNLRFQAYTSMAFGAENIIWACYTAGWWHNQAVDSDGKKTRQYGRLKRINAEIHTIADEYMKYRCVETHFVGFTGHPDMIATNQKVIDSLSASVFKDVKADTGAPLVIGELVSRTADNAAALMICAADDPHDRNPRQFNITFRAKNRCIKALGGNGYKAVMHLGDDKYAVAIASNEGVLITAKQI